MNSITFTCHSCRRALVPGGFGQIEHPYRKTGLTLCVEGLPTWTCSGCGTTQSSPIAADLIKSLLKRLHCSLLTAQRSASAREPQHVEFYDPAQPGGIKLTFGDAPENGLHGDDLPDFLRLCPRDDLVEGIQQEALAPSVAEGIRKWHDQWRFWPKIKEMLGPIAPPEHGPKPLNLWGHPGVGKGFIASVIASELDKPLLEMSYARIQSGKIGVTEERLSEAFEIANARRAVLFIDEADSLVSKRIVATTGYEGAQNIITNHFICLINRCEVPVLLATNLRDAYDPALASRFVDLLVPMPNATQRRRIWDRLIRSASQPVKPTMGAARIAQLDDVIEARGFGTDERPFTPRDMRDEVIPLAATLAAREDRTWKPKDFHTALNSVLDDREDVLGRQTMAKDELPSFLANLIALEDGTIADDLEEACRRERGDGDTDEDIWEQAANAEAQLEILRSVAEHAAHKLRRRADGLIESGLTEDADEDAWRALFEWLNAERDEICGEAAK